MATRRDFLKSTAAVAAIAATPAALVVASPSAVEALPAWTVGDLGEMNNRVVFAKDELSARAAYFFEEHGKPIGELCEGPCGVDDCACYDRVPDARRSPWFDNPQNAEPGQAELLSAGWTVCCDRCGYETTAEENAFAVTEKHVVTGRDVEIVVCSGCQTPAEIKANDIEDYEHRLRNEWIDEAVPGDLARLLAEDELS